MDIKEVKLADLNKIFWQNQPKGRFLAKTKCVWLALNNLVGGPVEMGFPTREAAVAWLSAEEPQKEKAPE